MTNEGKNSVEFEDDLEEEDVVESGTGPVRAMVQGTDWTVETLVNQLRRGNIQLNPRFQRRDAWNRARKSRLIESIIVGLPIPQIVLAESPDDPSKFLVLDGKQRLLSIYQFWGLAIGANNAFSLSSLSLRPELGRKTFADLEQDPGLEADFNALCNHSIRTVILRNWGSTDFLHTVFLRLNTGSVALSPQELRQALFPGPFADYVDLAAGDSAAIQSLLRLDGPDPRMRDTELLARFLGFHFFAPGYGGRMKRFLDDTFNTLNFGWKRWQPDVEDAVESFEIAVTSLNEIFQEEVARKPGSRQFNRAIFDALIYFHVDPDVRKAAELHPDKMRAAYRSLFNSDSEFRQAIESDTAGAPNTVTRMEVWAAALSEIAGKKVSAPAIGTSEGSTLTKRRPAGTASAKKVPVSRGSTKKASARKAPAKKAPAKGQGVSPRRAPRRSSKGDK
ncbi:MAG: DUF262 domain-containing protein [Myxococcales bacterium]|nr:DUF262 domain-containing protein [Myxococcales bacterium]